MTTIPTLRGDIVIEHPADKIAVMRMPRTLDEYTSPTVRQASLDLVHSGAYSIIADLGPVEFVTSAGLGVLLGMLKRARAHGGRVVVADMDDKTEKAFRVTGVLRHFEAYDSVDEALAALWSPSPGAAGAQPSFWSVSMSDYGYDDHDEVYADDEWRPGECDHCSGGDENGVTATGPLGPIYCACFIGQGADEEDCHCGPIADDQVGQPCARCS